MKISRKDDSGPRNRIQSTLPSWNIKESDTANLSYTQIRTVNQEELISELVQSQIC